MFHRAPTPSCLRAPSTQALSPFSPLLNRMLSVSWRSPDAPAPALMAIQWVSLWQTAFPPLGVPVSPAHPLGFFGLTALSVVAWLSNWFRFASRMELYHSVLGYSRPRLGLLSTAEALNAPAGLRFITFPSLGCGQCALFDAWPLWLVSTALRVACRWMGPILGRWTSRSGPSRSQTREGDHGGGGGAHSDWQAVVRTTRVFFPFTDVDEI